MPRKFEREVFSISVAAAGLTHDFTVPDSFFRSKVMQMTLITPDYTTATPTTTISFITASGVTYFTDSARAENSTIQVSLGSIVMHNGDIIRATLSGAAGDITTITVILHVEE